MTHVLFLGLPFFPLLALYNDPNPFGNPGLLLVFLSGLFAWYYSWLVQVVNRTTLWVAAGGVEVLHGPLPWWHRGGRYMASDLKGLQVVKKEHFSFRPATRNTTVFSIEANHEVLVHGWREREALDYMVECARRVVDSPSA